MDEQAFVRVAGPEEAAAISTLLYDFSGEALEPGDLCRRMAEAEVRLTAFLAELEGEPARLPVLRIVPDLSDPEDLAEITGLCVRRLARRKGIGGSLVETASRCAGRRAL